MPGAIVRSHYSIAGQTIATRVSGDPASGNNGLFFFYSDHLGSSTLLVNQSNNPIASSRTWYRPFGGYRGTAPTQTISDRDFTGQRENMELGLLYYNARFYVPGIGRFASADTIVPDPASPQSYNRYSYVLNSPLNFTDPTGHRPSDGCEYEGCSSDGENWGSNAVAYWSQNTDNPIGQITLDNFNFILPLALEDGASVEEAVMAALEAAIKQANAYGDATKLLKDRQLFAPIIVAGLSAGLENRPGGGNGEFSIINWNGYPHGVPRPTGPFRLVEGGEYSQARNAANAANARLHRTDSSFNGLHIHEIQPVKFGGSPTDIGNKIGLSPPLHRTVTTWWNRLQKLIEN